MIINKTKIFGQYFTPFSLAADIVSATKYLYCQTPIDVLEPAFGQGVFLSALQSEDVHFNDFLGIEIDTELKKNISNMRLYNCDFTELNPDKQYDLLITNPPYTRHHLLEKSYKESMSTHIYDELGIRINGLAGLHCYFILLADKWLKENGIAVWLLPTEFLDINYGKQIKEYLLNKVQLLKVHIYDTNISSLFNNATVSSCVIVYKKAHPNISRKIAFTFGDSMKSPERQKMFSHDILSNTSKWLNLVNPIYNGNTQTGDCPCVSDYFSIKRGIATGCNKYFILSNEEITKRNLPLNCFTPIIENARNIISPIIESDEDGLPINQNLFVLDTDLSIMEIEHRYPSLYEYLLYGLDLGVQNGYLVGKRRIWYKQENRKPAPFYCSYIARNRNGNGFRFIWNKSNSIVTNNFLMLYPKQRLVEAINQHLITYEDIFEQFALIENHNLAKQSRSYATGLYKLEPSELCKVELNLSI